jgi:hypothetical protein
VSTKKPKEQNESNGTESVERKKRNLSGSKNDSADDIVDTSNVKKQNNNVNKAEIGAIDSDIGVKQEHDNNKGINHFDTKDLVNKQDKQTHVCDNVKKSSTKEMTALNQTDSIADNAETGSKINTIETGSITVKEPKEVLDSERISSFINIEAKSYQVTNSADSKTGADTDTVNDRSNVTFGLGNVDNKEKVTSLDPNINNNRGGGLTPELRKKHPSGGNRDKSPIRKSQITQLTDHSDPLYSYQMSQDESIFHSSITFQEQLVTHRCVCLIKLYMIILSNVPV